MSKKVRAVLGKPQLYDPIVGSNHPYCTTPRGGCNHRYWQKKRVWRLGKGGMAKRSAGPTTERSTVKPWRR